jgi:hypothetical protein
MTAVPLDKVTISIALLGVVLWFPLVPHVHEQSADPRVAAYWWIMIGVAAALGLLLGKARAKSIAFGLVAPQFVLAIFTWPRGDNDGLWTLWLPLLLGFGAVLIIPAYVAGWLRDLIASA